MAVPNPDQAVSQMEWTDWAQGQEAALRIGCFIGVLMLMACWEVFAPRRPPTASRFIRWRSNIGIVLLDAVLLRLLVPATAAGAALFTAQRDWGLFNQLTVPEPLAIILSVVILDLVIYWQHVSFHAIPLFWRLHRVHHADPDFDVTTGVRFHPLEIILSMGIKLLAILMLGPPVIAVILFEIILNASSMFNHGNVRLPAAADRLLRLLLVTPDMHRVHHSSRMSETNSNYGFCLSWWDRIFRSYCAQPADGHLNMTIGLDNITEPSQTIELTGMLLLPFSADNLSANNAGRREPPT